MTKIIFFDLDGTLIDSRQDLANAVNFMRQTMGVEPLPQEQIVSMIGNGLRSLVQRATAGTSLDVDTCLKVMKERYFLHLTDETRLYPGVKEGLEEFHRRGLTLVVLSNKPTEPCRIILRDLGVAHCFQHVLGGDSPYPLKPEPDALLAICQECNCLPQDAWMVGDHYTDLEAGRRAGMPRVLAKYGFGNPKDEIPDAVINNFAQLTQIIA